MTDTKKLDIEKARLDPASTFSSPQAVVDHPDLDRDQKIEILKRWKFDATELAVAAEEGMAGGEPNLLSRVVDALNTLGAPSDEGSGPSKHGN